MKSKLSRLVELYESERYRRTYGRKADHSRAYAAAVAQREGTPSRIARARVRRAPARVA